MTHAKRRTASLVGRAGLLAIICVALGGLAVTPAAADPGNGAQVVRNPYGSPSYCNLVNQDFSEAWLFQCTIQIVTTPSGTVNEYLHGPVVAGSPLPTSALVQSNIPGFICDPTSGAIYWRGTLTPSGNVSLKCSSDPSFGS